MHDLQKQVERLQTDIANATQTIGLEAMVVELKDLAGQSQASDFWSDQQQAKKIMKRMDALHKRVDTWQGLQKTSAELIELVAMGDNSLADDLSKRCKQLDKDFQSQKTELAYSGPYDDHDIIMDIFAGAGGTDAQDWADMLLRMYIRWAESQDCTTDIIAKSEGDEAGIKSVTIEISGVFAYGKLKGEHGVHRLVRLSPFNADSLRQTSFAKVSVLPKIDSPESLDIDEKELKIDVYRAGGHGGQSVNTTDSAVRITHLPTGVTVSIQNERSQLQNKETAMTILRSRLALMQIEQHQQKLDALKGPNTTAEWGNQIRSYVLHPYKQVKDLRTRYETTNVQSVLDGSLDEFIAAYQAHTLGDSQP